MPSSRPIHGGGMHAGNMHVHLLAAGDESGKRMYKEVSDRMSPAEIGSPELTSFGMIAGSVSVVPMCSMWRVPFQCGDVPVYCLQLAHD